MIVVVDPSSALLLQDILKVLATQSLTCQRLVQFRLLMYYSVIKLKCFALVHGGEINRIVTTVNQFDPSETVPAALP
jgi:hypothetical protein